MDTCPAHISGDLWKSSCMLRIQVRSRGELARILNKLEEEVKEQNKAAEKESEENGEGYTLIEFAEKEGDICYEEKSQIKSLDLQISDKITSWSKGNDV